MRPAEDIKRLIKNLSDNTSAQMDQRMREDMLRALEDANQPSALTGPKIRRIIMKSPMRRAAAVVLICTGVVAAAVVGAKIYKWHIIGKDETGYLLQSEDGRIITNIPDSWADSPEHAVEVKEELDLQKQQGNRELVAVVDKEVNGQLDSRYLMYKHILSDGRVIEDGEYDPDETNPRILSREQREEMDELWHEQLRQGGDGGATIEERQVKGYVFSFHKWRLVLSDGTEVVYSIGRLKDD